MMKVMEGLMHNLVKDGMLVSEINRILYTELNVVTDRLGLVGKKKGNKFQKK